MTEAIITFFRELTGNDYLTLFIISMIPIVELRGAIIFMGGMDVNMVAGMLCCVAGSSIFITPIILLLRPLIRRMKNSKTFGKLGRALEENLSDRAPDVSEDGTVTKRMSAETKKFWGVLIFVAVPLPMTGSFSGSSIASILDFKLWKAVLSVFIGNIIAASIMTVIVAFVPEGYTDFVLYAFIILAVAIFLTLYLTRFAKREKKLAEEKAKHGGRSEYELHELQKEANRKGEELIKREYIDDDGNKHIVVGKDENRNKRAISTTDEI